MNMRDIKPLYIILSIFFILTSCEDAFETTLEIEPPEAPQALVMNCYIGQNDTLINMGISKVADLVEVDFALSKIDDAEVFIRNINSGEEKAFMPWETNNPYNYVQECDSDWFQPGEEYEIVATHPDYNTISATQLMPEVPTFTIREYNEDGGIDQEGDDASEIILDIDDLPGASYYKLSLFEYYEQDGFVSLGSAIELSSTDPSTLEGYNYFSLLMEDATFDGESKSITLKFRRNYTNHDRLALVIRGVTEDYFRCSKTLELEDESEDNPFQTPVQVYTNVESGFGIFSMHSEKSFIFDS